MLKRVARLRELNAYSASVEKICMPENSPLYSKCVTPENLYYASAVGYNQYYINKLCFYPILCQEKTQAQE